MKPGDIVKQIHHDNYAVVRYSSFGISLHMWNEEHQGMAKTLGQPVSEYEKHWQVVDKLPDDWEIGEHGLPQKKPQPSYLGVTIQGHIFKEDDTDLDEDEFYDEFISFIESKGWQFGGTIAQCNEDGDFVFHKRKD